MDTRHDAGPSRKANGRAAGGPTHGRIQPGEVRNPRGRNQYTYRRDFERTIDRLLAGGLSDDERDALPDYAQALVEPGMSRGEAIAQVVVGGALRGDPKLLLEALKRLWPETQKHEVERLERPQPPQPVIDWGKLTDEERKVMSKIRDKLMDPPRPVLDDDRDPIE